MSTEPVVRWTQEGNNITNGTVTLKIGDKIDYDPADGATTTTYTSPATKTGWEEDQVFNVSSLAKTSGENWRVFGVDETTGQVLIIPENFVGPTEGGYDLESESGATYYYLKGQDGYVNGVSELNKISDLYGHGKYATSARSINADDVNKITGFDPTSNFYNYNISMTDAVTEQLLVGTKNGYYYFTSNGSKFMYWLASSYSEDRGIYTAFGLGIVRSRGLSYEYLSDLYTYTYGVRPLVSLQSNINLKYNETSQEWQFVE